MKRNPGMTGTLLASRLAAVLLGAALLAPSLIQNAAADSDVVARTADGVSYVSGGVAKDSIDRLNAMAGDFNLKLVFALTSGDYLADVGVVIANAAGKTLLDTTSEGPWFMVRLPAGHYRITTTFAGTVVRREVAVGAAKLTTVDLRWAAR